MIIQKRYEQWTKEGKAFSPWFKMMECTTKEGGESLIKTFPKYTNKLKNEYRIYE